MNKKRIIYFSMMIGVMILIFLFSSQNGNESSSVSDEVFYKLREILKTDINATVIRKIAHLTEYLFLGITTLLYVGTFKNSDGISMFISTIICILYAVSDEIHQVFVSNRAGRVGDVFIDTIGAMLGICIIMLIILIIRKKNDKKITI